MKSIKYTAITYLFVGAMSMQAMESSLIKKQAKDNESLAKDLISKAEAITTTVRTNQDTIPFQVQRSINGSAFDLTTIAKNILRNQDENSLPKVPQSIMNQATTIFNDDMKMLCVNKPGMPHPGPGVYYYVTDYLSVLFQDKNDSNFHTIPPRSVPYMPNIIRAIYQNYTYVNSPGFHATFITRDWVKFTDTAISKLTENHIHIAPNFVATCVAYQWLKNRKK